MANRRMFNKKITESDAFLDMPLSSQCLYFHLNMNGDDDGFVNNPKMIMRLIGASDDDLKLLIAKAFVLTFDSGVIVIKHWRMNNTLLNDRYKPTDYQEEFRMLGLKDNKSYTWKQNDNILETQHNITKHNITKLKESESKEQNKKIKEINKRNKYGEYGHVLLTEEQHTNLIKDYGTDLVASYIRKIDEYIQMKGKGYKDYNLAIRNWIRNDNHKKDKAVDTLPIYKTENNPKIDESRLYELLSKRKG